MQLQESRFINSFIKIFEKTMSDGIRSTFKKYLRRIRDEYMDWKLGIQTTGFVPRSKLTDNESSRDYVATDYRCLRRLFKNIDIDDDTLVEFGCGKGRVLVVAALHPFRRVIGLEQSAELCAIARKNLERIKLPLVCHVEVIECDAADYDLPNDATIAFFFNPFGKDLLDVIQSKIVRSLNAFPRRFRIVYIFPAKNVDYFSSAQNFELTDEFSTTGWQKFKIRLYESK